MVMYDFVEEDDASSTLNIFYCSKRQKDKTQVKQLRNYKEETRGSQEPVIAHLDQSCFQ
jgi:predicted ferric reductase